MKTCVHQFGLLSLLFVLLIDLSACRQREEPSTNRTGNGSITVQVNGVRNASGQLVCLLFDRAAGFPEEGERAYRVKARGDISAGEPVQFSFSRLPPGTYAISVLHDENEDQTMDRTVLGIPEEGFGMSNNPSLAGGAPSFQDASFRLSGDQKTFPVTLHYLDEKEKPQ